MARLPLAVLSGALLCGCSGSLTGSDDANAGPTTQLDPTNDGTPTTLEVSCDTRPNAPTAPLRILGRTEYEGTLRNVFGDAVVDTALTPLSQLSDNRPRHDFRSTANGTTGGDVETRFAIADTLAAAAAQDMDLLGSVAPCLASEGQTPNCVDTFIDRLGLRLFRRPLSGDERAWLSSVYAEGSAITPNDGLGFVIFALLESPTFLYRLETEGKPDLDDANSLRLSSYELATRLAFFAWGTGPDAALLDQAAAGVLDDPAGLANELTRLLSDPRAREHLARFFGEWLEIENLPEVNQSEQFLDGIEGPGLADAMRDELSTTLLTLTLDNASSFSDLFTSNLSATSSLELAKIYGGTDSLDPSARAGLLTRGALLLTSGEETSPIRRGAFIKRKLLCDPIPPPDPNAFPAGAITPPEFNPEMTGRERWTIKTSEIACVGCHGMFNPFGFALENYDTIGRYRSEEVLVDPMTDMEIARLPIDARVDVVLDNGQPVTVDGAVELGQALAQSQQAQECFGTQWLRYNTGKSPDVVDQCVIDDVSAAIRDGTPLKDALARVALAPEFRLRRIPTQ